MLDIKNNIAYNQTVKKKGRKMPQKTTKKAATKPVAKKAPAKKPAKKVVKPAPVAKPVVAEIPMPDPYCHCTKRKRNMILTSVFIASFVLGMLVYGAFFCGCPHHKHMPRPHFVNGCMDVTSVKCPKMLNDLPTIDANGDGCITKQELRAAKRAIRHHEKPAPFEEPAVNVDEAIAPVME